MSFMASGFLGEAIPLVSSRTASGGAKAMFGFIQVGALALGVAIGLMCITTGLYLYISLLLSAYC